VKRFWFALLLVSVGTAACAGTAVLQPGAGGVPPSAALPDVATVVCDSDGSTITTTIGTPAVRPQTDGVHFEVDNRTGTDLGFELGGLGGDNAPAGTSEIVWPVPPGSASLRCSDPAQSSGGQAGMATLEVRDTDGLWVGDRIDCGPSGIVAAGTIDYVPDAAGAVGNPVDLAKRELASKLLEGDQVVHGGYPVAAEGEVVVTRDGAVVASLTYVPDQAGTGWLLSERQTCQDF
jgi:hypothetical protein